MLILSRRFVFVFIFHTINHYRMASDTSKKEDLQKREREKERKKESKHIITLGQYITRTIHDLPHFIKYVGMFSSCIGRTVLILKVTGFCGRHCC